MIRPSEAVRVVKEALGSIVLVAVGLAAIAGGSWIVKTALAHEPHDNKIIYLGVGLAVVGGLVIPGIFPAVQRVYVLVFPNGLPLIGGKRATDPPAPPTP